MKRVSTGLARGILLAAVVFSGGRLADPAPSPLEKTLRHLRSQNFTPIFEVARKRVEGHFTVEREGAFFESLFSMSGKWKALTRGPEAYARFVRRSFEKTLVEPAELRRVGEAIRQDWAFGAAAARNRLLAVLQEDLLPLHPGLALPELRAEFDRLAGELLPSVLQDLGLNLVSIAGSEAAVVILTAALGSTGLLGEAAMAGAAGGPWTLGVGLAIGLAVGLAIDLTAGEAYENVARQRIHLQVDEVRNRMVDDVYEALARAVISYRVLQERCVRALHEGRLHELSAARR
jgi:hypothetical protein